MRLAQPKTQLFGKSCVLEKVAFWAKAKNALRTCKSYGPLGVHKPKSTCVLKVSVGLVTQLPNYPDKKSSSVLMPDMRNFIFV